MYVQWSLCVLTCLTFSISTFCPHSVFMCFVWIWEQTAIISLYSINWLVCITETECVYCAVRTEHLTFTNSTFCPHTVFMCFVWIWERTAIISLYSINWLVCITETECVYCAVRTEHLTLFRLNFVFNHSNAVTWLISCNSAACCVAGGSVIVNIILTSVAIWKPRPQQMASIFLSNMASFDTHSCLQLFYPFQ